MTRTAQHLAAAIVAVLLTATLFATVVTVPDASTPSGVAAPMLA